MHNRVAPLTQSTFAVICGEEINRLDDKQWDDLMQKQNLVFARTTPEQKLNIVEQCQKRDEIVAVTGKILKRPEISLVSGMLLIK